MNCKLIGQSVQHLEVTLMPGEDFYTEKGTIIYHEAGIEKDTSLNGNSLGGLIGAKLSGENLIILRLYNPTGVPRKFVIGSSYGLVPVKLQGESMICHRGVYVASNNRVNVTTKLSIAGLTGGMGLMLQKIEGNSTVFLDTKGQPIIVNLGQSEVIEVDENHIIALHNITEQQMQARWSLGNLFKGEGLSMMRIYGPGTVYMSPRRFYTQA